MNDIDTTALTSEQVKRLVAHERLMREIMDIRNPPKQQRWWESAALMSAVVAIVSIVLSSSAAYYSQREADLRQQRITMTRERWQQQLTVLSNLHRLVSRVMKASQDRLDVAS